MSIHVCKCIHNGTEEFHLRMPGVPESRAEAIASLINSGKLDQADYQAATSRQEARIEALRDSLNWALSSIIEEPYEWSSEENMDAHNAAIAAAKETP